MSPTPAEIAAADQRAAAARDLDRKIQRGAGAFLALVAAGTVYLVLAISGVVPVAPWSPIGQAQQITDQPGTTITPDPNDLEHGNRDAVGEAPA